MSEDRKPLATIEEVAAYVRLTESTLYDQRKRGVGLGALATKVGRELRWNWSDVDGYLANQRKDAP